MGLLLPFFQMRKLNVWHIGWGAITSVPCKNPPLAKRACHGSRVRASFPFTCRMPVRWMPETTADTFQVRNGNHRLVWWQAEADTRPSNNVKFHIAEVLREQINISLLK
jgi:hypothetical protein